ncbi:Uncharacterised protein [Mycobacteroides abscessus subsp. abscessus]|nr:Uncharacterised protein [Mycobacteroides abscessus subsp. abscessus]
MPVVPRTTSRTCARLFDTEFASFDSPSVETIERSLMFEYGATSSPAMSGSTSRTFERTAASLNFLYASAWASSARASASPRALIASASAWPSRRIASASFDRRWSSAAASARPWASIS